MATLSSEVSFFGMVGTSGTLPLHYTEVLLDRLHAKDSALADFLDAFQDRSVAFFYRAFSKYHLPAAHRTVDDERGQLDPIANVRESLLS